MHLYMTLFPCPPHGEGTTHELNIMMYNACARVVIVTEPLDHTKQPAIPTRVSRGFHEMT